MWLSNEMVSAMNSGEPADSTIVDPMLEGSASWEATVVSSDAAAPRDATTFDPMLVGSASWEATTSTIILRLSTNAERASTYFSDAFSDVSIENASNKRKYCWRQSACHAERVSTAFNRSSSVLAVENNSKDITPTGFSFACDAQRLPLSPAVAQRGR